MHLKFYQEQEKYAQLNSFTEYLVMTVASIVHIILHLICTQHSKEDLNSCAEPMRKLGVEKALMPKVNCQDESKPASKAMYV